MNKDMNDCSSSNNRGEFLIRLLKLLQFVLKLIKKTYLIGIG